MNRKDIEKLDKQALIDYVLLNEHIKGDWYILTKRKSSTTVYVMSISDDATRWQRIRSWWALFKKALLSK